MGIDVANQQIEDCCFYEPAFLYDWAACSIKDPRYRGDVEATTVGAPSLILLTRTQSKGLTKVLLVTPAHDAVVHPSVEAFYDQDLKPVYIDELSTGCWNTEVSRQT